MDCSARSVSKRDQDFHLANFTDYDDEMKHYEHGSSVGCTWADIHDHTLSEQVWDLTHPKHDAMAQSQQSQQALGCHN